ncbi:hypothetical protein FHG87_010674 [Trinorchestia longiramus]|nr:hypothetical protein FHG87_010674 [Trinorchestia longiramus]
MPTPAFLPYFAATAQNGPQERHRRQTKAPGHSLIAACGGPDRSCQLPTFSIKSRSLIANLNLRPTVSRLPGSGFQPGDISSKTPREMTDNKDSIVDTSQAPHHHRDNEFVIALSLLLGFLFMLLVDKFSSSGSFHYSSVRGDVENNQSTGNL